MTPTIVISGSSTATVQKAIGKTLSDFGLEIHEVWTREQSNTYLKDRKVPDPVGAVVILTDTIEGLSVATELSQIRLKSNSGNIVPCIFSSRQTEQLEKCLIIAGFYRVDYQPIEHVNIKDKHLTEAHFDFMEAQQLAKSESPDWDEETTVTELKPAPTTATFDSLIKQLKDVLKELRDKHYVDQINFNLDDGLNIYRRQSIKETLD